jgi:hypothetical protein
LVKFKEKKKGVPAHNRELMTKLNEVIEAVNKMMEVINERVKQ